MATASHAAGLELRHRPPGRCKLSLGTGWRGFERPGAAEKVYPTGSEKLTHNEVAGIIGRHRACFANLSSCDSTGGRA
jgi:hypothetical protein